METNEVRALLTKFQEGYARRDQSFLDEFMELYISGDELELIGTNAVDLKGDEWCRGREAVRRLISNDWQYWGEVVYDVEGARIHVRGETAWLATTGSVTDTITNEERYAGFLGYVKAVLEEEGPSEQMKMLDILKLGNDLALSLPLSSTCEWPFRFTAVAVKEKGEWRFHQMQFSFATTRAPDVRTR